MAVLLPCTLLLYIGWTMYADPAGTLRMIDELSRALLRYQFRGQPDRIAMVKSASGPATKTARLTVRICGLSLALLNVAVIASVLP